MLKLQTLAQVRVEDFSSYIGKLSTPRELVCSLLESVALALGSRYLTAFRVQLLR